MGGWVGGWVGGEALPRRRLRAAGAGGHLSCTLPPWLSNQAALLAAPLTTTAPPPRSYADANPRSPFAVRLAPGQCELRWQRLAAPALIAPPFLLANGPGVGFRCGSPLYYAAPQLPGFLAYPGRGIFNFGRFNCSQPTLSAWGRAAAVAPPRRLPGHHRHLLPLAAARALYRPWHTAGPGPPPRSRPRAAACRYEGDCGYPATMEQVGRDCRAEPRCALLLVKQGGLPRGEGRALNRYGCMPEAPRVHMAIS